MTRPCVRATALGIATVVVALAIAGAAVRAQDASVFRDPKARELLTAGPVAVFGAPNGAARLVFDAKTRLPSRLAYRAPDRTTLTVTLTDRRTTGGHRLPFRVVTNAGTRIVDERSFEEIVVGAPLGKSDFAP